MKCQFCDFETPNKIALANHWDNVHKPAPVEAEKELSEILQDFLGVVHAILEKGLAGDFTDVELPDNQTLKTALLAWRDKAVAKATYKPARMVELMADGLSYEEADQLTDGAKDE